LTGSWYSGADVVYWKFSVNSNTSLYDCISHMLASTFHFELIITITSFLCFLVPYSTPKKILLLSTIIFISKSFKNYLFIIFLSFTKSLILILYSTSYFALTFLQLLAWSAPIFILVVVYLNDTYSKPFPKLVSNSFCSIYSTLN